MRRFSNLQALVLSFFSRDLYRDAMGQWKGAGLLYALILAALVAVVVTIRIHLGVSEFTSKVAPQIIAQLPTITIENGRLGVDKPSPIHIQDPRTGNVVAIIDTTATLADLEGSAASVLATRDRIAFRKSANETRVFELGHGQRFVFTREIVTGWVRAAGTWMAALCFPFILAGVYVGRLLQVLFTSLITMVVARIRHVPLGFAATMRLAALAMTPATLLLDLAGFLGAHVPGSGWLWCAFTILYAMFAVDACRPWPAEQAPVSAAPPAPPAPPA
jgi:hypothetical protein